MVSQNALRLLGVLLTSRRYSLLERPDELLGRCQRQGQLCIGQGITYFRVTQCLCGVARARGSRKRVSWARTQTRGECWSL